MAAASESVVQPTENGSSKIVTNGKANDDVTTRCNDVTTRCNDVVENDAAKNKADGAENENKSAITLNSSLDNTEQLGSNSQQNSTCSIRVNGVDRSIDDVTMATYEEEVRVKPSDSGSCTSSISGQVQVELVTASSSSSMSHDTSSYSQDMLDSVSLPPERSACSAMGKKATRTVSDPAIRLALIDGLNQDKLDRSCLLEEIVSLKMEILKLQEENEKLKKVRMEMDEDIHNLTENLFSEAYKMVDEAKGDKVHAEKRLADAAGQIEAMETKVSTLNNLLHTKTSPSLSHHSPHTHKVRRPSVKKLVKKITRKSTKHKGAAAMSLVEDKVNDTKFSMLKEGELVSSEFKLFCEWMEKGLPILPNSHSFMDSILAQQIMPCLAFSNEDLSGRVHKAVEENTLFIESVLNTSSDVATFNVPCSLTNESGSPCSYRLKLEDSTLWYYISANCRDRIVAVCDFYTFITYIRKGIIKKDDTELFWQVCRHRGCMSLASLGLSLPDQS